MVKQSGLQAGHFPTFKKNNFLSWRNGAILSQGEEMKCIAVLTYASSSSLELFDFILIVTADDLHASLEQSRDRYVE